MAEINESVNVIISFYAVDGTVVMPLSAEIIPIYTGQAKLPLDYNSNSPTIELDSDVVSTIIESCEKAKYSISLTKKLAYSSDIPEIYYDNAFSKKVTTDSNNLTTDCEMTVVNDTPIMANINMYLKLEDRQKYKVTFTWNGTIIQKEILEGKCITAPKVTSYVAAVEETEETKKTYNVYTFSHWKNGENIFDLETTPITGELTLEADYTETTLASNYLNNNSYIFSQAVPYYYGSGSPTINYYNPIGEDDLVEDPENDIKIQIASGDIYTVTESLDNFCIDGQPINYIKKGTFPKLRSENIQTDSNAEAIWQPDPLWQHNLTKANEDASNCNNFVIIGEFDKEKKLTHIKCKDLTASPTSTTEVVTTTALKEFYPDEFTDEGSLPTRLGFVMTAGGGGGAGVNRIDTGSSCSDDTVPIAGGGGGGASTALGVLKFDCPEIVFRTVFLEGKYQSLLGVVGKIDGTDLDEFYPVVDPSSPTTYITKDQNIDINNLYVSSVRFHITGGRHGKGNGDSGKRVEKSANNGSDGYDSAILVNFYLHSVDELEPSEDNKMYETSDGGTIRKVVTVCGGCGGEAATSASDGTIKGGTGGIITDSYAPKTSAFIYHLKSFAGSAGASVAISGESGTPGKLAAYNLDLTSAYYSNTPDNKEYRIELSYAAEVGGVVDEDKRNGCLYGGYSFGRGSRGTTMCAEFGGGGCCLKTNEGSKDEDKASNPDSSQDNDNYQLNEPTNGADGYFALFY